MNPKLIPFRTISLFLFLSFLFICCNSTSEKETASLIFENGILHTVDPNNPSATAIAVTGNKITAVGTNEEINAFKGEDTKIIDLEGNCLIPGLIEGHGHYSGLGSSLVNLNFLASKNWQEIIDMVAAKVEEVEDGEWIIGRGWHQEKWDTPLDREVNGYPYHFALSQVSPNNPVFLNHASGHAAFANAKAMELAGVSRETPDPRGGKIIRNPNGDPIGVFEETAEEILDVAYEEYTSGLSAEQLHQEWLKQLKLAEKECLENGITSFHDAGASLKRVNQYKELAEAGELGVRLWVMMADSIHKMEASAPDFPIVDVGNGFFTCRSIKSYIDGALGSYGAWLLKPYNDSPDFHGQNVRPVKDIIRISEIAIKNGLQHCVHAIGDRANREVLNIFEAAFSANPEVEDPRWRIEHAQHVNTNDILRFGPLGVIASIQGIHCTSDAPFVEKRLGLERARDEAYPWRSFLDAGASIANGTDAPVEDISPIECYYALVSRKRIDNGMEFFTEQRMTRLEALRSYTLDNAYAAFEEEVKGSLEVGKLADFTILSNDIINCTEDEILDTKILYTVIDGVIKYDASE
ncbi:MAG: amidohydrolase [Bacteroidota bacterium]